MKVVTIGELVVDWIAVNRSASWQEPHTFIRSLGGNSANVALGLARLGGDVRLVAKVGADMVTTSCNILRVSMSTPLLFFRPRNFRRRSATSSPTMAAKTSFSIGQDPMPVIN
jgi:hypothetical protein